MTGMHSKDYGISVKCSRTYPLPNVVPRSTILIFHPKGELHMRVGVLGSGMVAQGLSARLAELGHNVVIGTRDADKLRGWQSSNQRVLIGSFAETAAHGEMVINATNGAASLSALSMAGDENLTDKILVDVSNPLDFSDGFPPSLTVFGKDSLAEQIQRAFPMAKVVKTLNTVTARVMTHPLEVANGDHHVFISANDLEAKGHVTDVHKSIRIIMGKTLWRDEHRHAQHEGHEIKLISSRRTEIAPSTATCIMLSPEQTFLSRGGSSHFVLVPDLLHPQEYLQT